MRFNENVKKQIRRIKITGALGLILSLSLTVSAVSQEKAEFELSGFSSVGIGELGRRIDHAAWGGAFYVGLRLRRTPFSLGARLAMAGYDSEHNVDLAGYSDSVPADVKYGYNLLQTHLVVRFQSWQSLFAPYLEAFVGFNYFFTQMYTGKGSSVPIIAGDAIILIGGNGSQTLMSSVTPSIGLGGGLKVRLASISRGKHADSSLFSLLLNLQGRYVYGGTARYLKPGGITLDGKRLIYDPQRSRSDMFTFSLGLSVRL